MAPFKTAAALAGLVLAGAAARAQEAPSDAKALDPRRDMAGLERVLEGAVRQVSRASPAHALSGAEACRSYALTGYGAVFVLAPRLLPTPSRATFAPFPGFEMNEANLERAVRSTEEQLVRVPSPEIRIFIQQRLDALRRTQALLKARQVEEQQAQQVAQQAERVTSARQVKPRSEEEARQAEIRAFEEQARAFDREADQAREEAEQAIRQFFRQVGERPPASPTVPDAPSEQTPPAPPAPLAPPPPWRFWFDGEDETGRTPENVVRDVRAAVTNALEAHGSDLRLLQPEEYLVVAVDFFPRGSFGPWERPQRTLIVRVKKRELLDRQAGKLAPEELRKRIEYLEY